MYFMLMILTWFRVLFFFSAAFLILLQCVDVDVELLQWVRFDGDAIGVNGISGWMHSERTLINSFVIRGIIFND